MNGEWARAPDRHARRAARGLVIVLVGAVDRRMLPALALVPQLADCDARAIHVCLDQTEACQLAMAWMDFGLDWLPLQIEDPTSVSLVESVRHIVEREAIARPRVTVLVPEMDLGRWWQPLLHRGTGRHIAWHLHELRRVTTVVLPVPVRIEDPDRPQPSR
jgi:hypothetical protein